MADNTLTSVLGTHLKWAVHASLPYRNHVRLRDGVGNLIVFGIDEPKWEALPVIISKKESFQVREQRSGGYLVDKDTSLVPVMRSVDRLLIDPVIRKVPVIESMEGLGFGTIMGPTRLVDVVDPPFLKFPFPPGHRGGRYLTCMQAYDILFKVG